MARLGTRSLVVTALLFFGGLVLWSQWSPTVEVSPEPALSVTDPVEQSIIAEYFAPLIPFSIGSTTIRVSVADTRETRIQGLSDTPELPTDIGKLFVFETDDAWSIWMKDMQYPLDIIWLDATKQIVHIEENVSPATYPESFSSPIPARYVLEINASATAQYGWTVGDEAAW